MIPRYPDGVREGRPRGRPRVAEPLEPVSTRVPLHVYDQLVRTATARDVSVANLLRQIIILRLPRE